MDGKRWLLVVFLVVVVGIVLLLSTEGSRPASTAGGAQRQPTFLARLWNAVTGGGGDIVRRLPSTDEEARSLAELARGGVPAGATGELVASATTAAATGAIAGATGPGLGPLAHGDPDSATGAHLTQAHGDPQAASGEIQSATGTIRDGTGTETLRDSLSPTPREGEGSPTPTPAGPGGVQGRVTGRESGRPMPAVEIRLTGDDGSMLQRTTESDGVYRFDGVQPGRYTVLAVAASRSERNVEVRSGVWETVDFVLSDGTSVSGRVIDQMGSGLAGAEVRLLRSSTALAGRDELLDESVTDGDGSYTLYNAPVGELVRVEALHMGYSPESNGPFVVYGEPKTGVDITLRPGGSITGFVRDNAGKPIAGAELEARVIGTWSSRGDSLPLERPRTDNDGYYEFLSLPFGEWEVRAVAPGYSSQHKTVTLPESSPTRELNFVLEPGDSILGQVIHEDQPVSGAEVFLHGSAHSDETKSDQDGAFEFGGVPEGTYVVTARHPQYSTGRQAQVQAGAEDVVIRLSAKGVLSIRVLNPDGQPIQPYHVVIDPRMADYMVDPDQVREADVDHREGRASWSLAAGNYRVTVSAEGYRPNQLDLGVTAGETDQEHEIRLDWGRTLTGVVLDGNDGSSPVPGAQLEWYFGHIDVQPGGFHTPLLGDPGESTRADDYGVFTFSSLPPEAVTVRARAQGYAPWFSEGLNMADPPDYLTVRLQRGGTLTGRIWHKGAPFGDRRVELESVAAPGQIPPEWITNTDLQGQFTIEGVPDGEYVLRLRKWYRSSYLYRRYLITMAGGALDLDLTLPGGEVHALITDVSEGGTLSRATVTLTPLSIQPLPPPELLLPEPTLTLREPDGEGRYTFVCLPAGEYRLEGSFADRTLAPFTVQLAEDEERYLDLQMF